MKVLTLWQPHASLCVTINPATGLPYKTIETRSWSTKYRGPLAIHAARKVLPYDRRQVKGWGVEQQPLAEGGGLWLVGPGRKRGWTLLPLGAVVATCTLVDVVPICAIEEDELPPCVAVGPTDLTLWEVPDYWHNESDEVDISDQRPYGDFTPGRYAFLLADVVPVDPPVSFKGGQGLTKTWEP